MKNIWIWVVVIVIVIGGGYWYWQSTQTPAMDMTTPTTTTDTTGTDTTGTTGTGTTAPMTAAVTYDGSNFSPSTVTIASGGTVTFTSTGPNMWVASDPHPVHTGYDGTSMQQHCASGYAGAAPFDQCVGGTSFSFTFTKTGSWGYHDHLNPGNQGTVIVQ